ncbi:MAG: pirin family protein [Flavitalea sp.]
MSNLSLIIEERPTEIGNFLVGRLLPFRGKRMVGPFIFIDHMGPADSDTGGLINIGPHPHIGLSTLTYLFEGSIRHKDTLGTSMIIDPGHVNWMTAGKGIVHSERTPEHLINTGQLLHGLQIWVALPKEFEDCDPSFHHSDAKDLPAWEENGVKYKLIAGELKGHKSPVPVYSKLFMLEIKATEESFIDLNGALYGEAGMYMLEGSIETDGNEYQPRRILVAKDAKLCSFTMRAGTTVYIFGGETFPEERHIFWNFVSTSQQKIDEARQRWVDQRFGRIEGENDIVPMPLTRPVG